jgi:hypothetical protein
MERMEKTLESTKSSFNTVRTGRANPSLLDRVHVSFYLSSHFRYISTCIIWKMWWVGNRSWGKSFGLSKSQFTFWPRSLAMLLEYQVFWSTLLILWLLLNARWSIMELMSYSRVLRKLALQMVVRSSSRLLTSRGNFTNTFHLLIFSSFLCLDKLC